MRINNVNENLEPIMYFNAGFQKRLIETMKAVACGRKVEIRVSDYGYNCCIALQKTNGQWITSMIPRRYNPVDPSKADQTMLAFMGFLPKEFQINNLEDAIVFAQLWTEEHCAD